jgi:CheY-like chemotaxis protein
VASVLLIDDEAPVLASLQSMLEKSGGHKVRAVSNGPDAIKLLGESPPDIVITDLLLPEMDGIDIIRAIRALDQVTPIIAVTGDPQMTRRGEHFVSAKTAGATAMLVKPFRAAVLCNLVNDLLREHRKNEPEA